MTTSGSVVGEPVLLLSLLASIDLFNSILINVASVARAGLRPAFRHPSDAGRAPSHPLHRDFHFGLPGPVQYTPTRHPLILQVALFLREPPLPPQDAVVALRQESKPANPIPLRSAGCAEERFAGPRSAILHLMIRVALTWLLSE